MPKSADILLTNAIVLTMDEELNLYEPGAVAIKGNSILAVGPEAELKNDYPSSQPFDCQGKVLMPGLVNAHTHVPMTLLRGLADDLRLDVWLLGYMMPVEREFVSPDFVRLGTLIGCAEFIRTGITSFADMYYFEEDVAKATVEAGLRGVLGQTVLKFPSPDANSYEDSLEAAREFIVGWKNHELIVPAVSPHAPFTCTADILRSCAALAAEFDVPLHTHISETAIEVENMRRENDMPVIPYIKKQNLFDAKVLAAHCVHLDFGEIITLKHYNAGVAHNPSSNMKLASGMAPVTKMLEEGVNVGIGTDGPSSNNDLDMFEEIRLASFMAKIRENSPTALPARQALLMATRMGADAMHIGHLTGSLEPGKRADLILVDIDTLHNSPRFRRDPNGIYAQLVYAAKSTDVTDVMVNGRWLMRDKELLTIKLPALMEEVQSYAEKIDHFLIRREQSVLAKLIAIGGATEGESYEVQAKVQISDHAPIIEALNKPEIEVVYTRHYHEYDTYFNFTDPEQGSVRHREDEFINEKHEVEYVRARLTHVGPTREEEFPSKILLSRSRFLAPANQSLRFLREYFTPDKELYIEKDRLRWLVRYKDEEFYVNIDDVKKPQLGSYLEVKSRTWSRTDAEEKAALIAELITVLGADPQKTVTQDYAEIVNQTLKG
ncbi:MAG TPA: amidohydrolase family protein [Anaerolineales bacterium]|jgi:5-methylthioadenosine/S-adenosylhomocysteine deaminase|nr:amidohydrolase family protein [Anaerolineales bacterium]